MYVSYLCMQSLLVSLIKILFLNCQGFKIKTEILKQYQHIFVTKQKNLYYFRN